MPEDRCLALQAFPTLKEGTLGQAFHQDERKAQKLLLQTDNGA